jgi:DNA polymerase III delta prime subunit
VDWVWEPYLSTGTVALLSGDPGVGKTYLALAIAAQISNKQQDSNKLQATSGKQEKPTENRELRTENSLETGNRKLETRDVLYMGSCDSPAQVLRPRFDALKGDPTRFHLLRFDPSSKLQATSHKPKNSNTMPATENRELGTENSPENCKPETGNRKLFSLLGRTFLPQRALRTQRKTIPDPALAPDSAVPPLRTSASSGVERFGDIKLLALLDEALRQTRARLLIIDPLESLLAALGIGPRSQKLRRLMDQFVQLAEEHQCCVLLVRNISRSATGKASAHALGSLELTGAVRSHLLAGVSPENPDQRALVQMKSNLSALGPGLGYSIDSAGIFHWTGATQLVPEEMLSPPRDAEQKSALEEAEDFLHGALADGPENVWKIQRDAKEMMIAPITLQRAKRRLGLVSRKSAGSWQWFIPEKSNKPQAPSGKQENSTEPQAASKGFPFPVSGFQKEPEASLQPPASSGKEECGSKLAETMPAGQRETGDTERENGFNDHLDHLDHLHIGRTKPSGDLAIG